MIQISPQAKIFAYRDSVEMGQDIDAYASIPRRNGFDPFSDSLFAFRDREMNTIGILGYDGHGFHWCIKRFSAGKVSWWPPQPGFTSISSRDLQVLLWGGNPKSHDFPEMWKPLHLTK